MSEIVQRVEEDDIYTEDEVCIGTYLGKPLYRRIWKTNFVLPKTAESPKFYGFEATKPAGYVTKLDAVLYCPYNTLAGAGASSPFVSMYWSANPDKIILDRTNDITSADVYCKAIIAEYTKSTW